MTTDSNAFTPPAALAGVRIGLAAPRPDADVRRAFDVGRGLAGIPPGPGRSAAGYAKAPVRAGRRAGALGKGRRTPPAGTADVGEAT